MGDSHSPVKEAFQRLEVAAARALEGVADLRDDLDEAKRLNEGLVGLLESFQSGDVDPAELSERISRLSDENEELRRRLDEGRAAAERLLAKIRFLEDRS